VRPLPEKRLEKRFAFFAAHDGNAASMGPAPQRWTRAERLLCVRLDAIGDLIMTGPAIRALEEQRPGRRLTVLTSESGAAAARLLPGVSEVIAHPAPWMKASRPAAGGRADEELIARLRAERFDAAVIFTVFSQSPLPAALLCHLAGIPLRLAHCRENPYALLGEGWVPEREPEDFVRHEVRRQLDLVAAVGAVPEHERLELKLPSRAHDRAGALLASLQLDRERQWAVVHPGSTAPSRRYPPELWAECCARLAGEEEVQLVFTGQREDGGLVDSIRRAAGVATHSLVGELELEELAAVLAEAPLLLAGNTGPVHVAAAMGTPVVDLYALTNPQHTPWQVPHRLLFRDVPCRWCYKSICPEGHHLCLRGVAPEEVVGASLELLGSVPATV
jgi:lipopolysaccharide heptosyltransferase II